MTAPNAGDGKGAVDAPGAPGGPLALPVSPAHESADFRLADAAQPGSPTRRPETGRARFDALELAAVLSNFDTGVIESIRDFPRGSSRSPKVVLKCERGLFLLKRRAPGRDDARKVAFSHEVHERLAARRYPVPGLVRLRRGPTSLLAIEGRIYELFQYVHSTGWDASAGATEAAGRALAQFHRTLADHRPDWIPPAGGYHNAARVRAYLEAVPDRLAALRRSDAGLRSTVCFLADRYEEAAARTEKAGLSSWPRQVVHGDWHPGNLLFRGPTVVATLDFDAARLEPRCLDIANGALQFSVTMRGDHPDQWPASLDEDRLLAFCRGYDQVVGCRIATGEIDSLVWLMIEALIVEAVMPIVATGGFAQLEGGPFLRMVERKVTWLCEHSERLAAHVSG